MAGVAWVCVGQVLEGLSLEAKGAADPCAVATWWSEGTRHFPLALLISLEFCTHLKPHPAPNLLAQHAVGSAS